MDHAHAPSSTSSGQRRVALHKARLTTRAVAGAKTGDRRCVARVTEPTGFGVRISPSGLRSFIVQYRTHEGGRPAANRKQVLGHSPHLASARARSRAREVLRAAAKGRGERHGAPVSIPTLRDALR